ncbi:SAV_2336 N-terminal domain-related protein [Streptomyces europaeiscabiei]|uniref:SAV_2336 N-terminal domain-related protein n=1 Tax=Streptomyces europaeiscabiei TaxID=146819 RepID=UPI0029A98477|nr:SAV_2336 N-terminal domain-related protein [Streptomyces europaeiscabiei]MDX3694713.1 SAV_2336 N-terminal domain-related protein [Streptomyces europaeiscabiei]
MPMTPALSESTSFTDGRSPAGLRLQIVADTGPTMPLWEPLLHDLERLAAETGAFDAIEVSHLSPDGTLGHRQQADAVTLVLSDCVGPQWRPGPAGVRWFQTLHDWAGRRLVAVVQPLPERMWRQTAFQGKPGTILTPAGGSPNALLRFTPYETPTWHDQDESEGFLIPILEASPTWLAHWLRLVEGPGGAAAPASVGRVAPLPVLYDGPRARPADLSAEDLVLRFRATASPQAFRLAGHLAVGIAQLPVMCLVQDAVEPQAQRSHLAEVILSGMLRALPDSPGSYAFREGVCELLLSSLPNSLFRRTVAALTHAAADAVPGPEAAPAEGRGLAQAAAARLKGTEVFDPAFVFLSTASLKRLQAA